MEENPEVRQLESGQTITRANLESLTTSDLIRMADNFGIEIPPDLDRIFIIEELLEITSPDEYKNDDSADSDLMDLVLVESAPLPKQYNISFIEVMIRDPLWAFVFWEINAQEKEQFENDPDFDGYFLKISPLQRNAKGVFTVPVKPEDNAWYLGLNAAAADGPAEQNQYKVELCAASGGEETVIVVSNPIGLPELPSSLGQQETGSSANPLLLLSGCRDLHILRRNERLLRTKKDNTAGFYE